MSILEDALRFMPYLKSLLGENSTIIVSDTNSYIYYDPGQVDFGFSVGDEIVDGTLMDKTIKGGQKIVAKVSLEQSKFPFPYIATTTPLKEGNRVIGVIAIAHSTDTEEKINNMSRDLAETTNQLAGVSENLTGGAQELASIAQTMAEEAETVTQQIHQTEQIMRIIHEISDSTHMLGLNAAIEAARAGEMGRGFSVVAEEIRKLAANSKQSSKNIKDNLEKMTQILSRLSSETANIAALSEEQAASTEETNASIQQLQAVAEELQHIAEVLINK